MTLPTTIPAPLARALEKKGYESLTEVQTAVLADGLSDADLLVSAQTGSGKTAAFGMAIASTILGEGDSFDFAAAPLALVVAPTRELALQVQRELEWLYGEAYGRIASCVGGMDPRTERRALQRGCHVVVGTPGRLRDHIERGALDMSALRAVVLDEADEMLDFGFREDLEFILDSAPADRRTLLFSATVPKETPSCRSSSGIRASLVQGGGCGRVRAARAPPKGVPGGASRARSSICGLHVHKDAQIQRLHQLTLTLILTCTLSLSHPSPNRNPNLTRTLT